MATFRQLGYLDRIHNALNAFETVLLHNAPMGPDDLTTRAALLEAARDALDRLADSL